MPKLNRATISRLVPIAAPLLIALGLTFTFLTVPRQPYHLDDAFSWNAVLNLAHDQGWQFGDQIIFTYGPFGYLLGRYYFPGHDPLLFNFCFCFLTAASISFLAWRMGRWRGAWLIVVFALVSANLDPRADLLLFVNLFAWALLCWLDRQRRSAVWELLFLATAAFASLAKVSFIFISLLTLAALVLGLASDGRARAGLGLLIGFPAAFVAGWILSNQRIDHLGTFLAGAWTFSRDYDSAMALDRIPNPRLAGLLLVLCLFAAISIRTLPQFWQRSRRETWNATCLAVWLLGLVFVAAKYGLVRADLYHELVLFGFGPILAVAVQALPCHKPVFSRCSIGFSAVACGIGLFTLQGLFVSNFTAFLLQPAQAIPLNLHALFNPGQWQQRMLAQLELIRQPATLPKSCELIGRTEVDVFGHDQSYALLNQLSYHPRPVFQSYLAYNRRLMGWNAEWLLQTRPSFVLFNLSPIDRRFPPLEDSWTLRELLANYQPVLEEKPFILLKASRRRDSSLSLLKEGSLKANEWLSLEPFGQTNLWIELDARPTLLGRLCQALYKLPMPRIRVAIDDEQRNYRGYRAPPSMLAAGFLASPLLLNNDDVARWYDGAQTRRPRAYALDFGTGNSGLWKETFSYRVYGLEQIQKR